MDDLISRAEVINAIKHLTIKGNSINAADIISVLFQLPSAERRGKNISISGFMCLACGFGDFGGFHGYEPKYCPNCGAKMESKE